MKTLRKLYIELLKYFNLLRVYFAQELWYKFYVVKECLRRHTEGTMGYNAPRQTNPLGYHATYFTCWPITRKNGTNGHSLLHWEAR